MYKTLVFQEKNDGYWHGKKTDLVLDPMALPHVINDVGDSEKYTHIKLIASDGRTEMIDLRERDAVEEGGDYDHLSYIDDEFQKAQKDLDFDMDADAVYDEAHRIHQLLKNARGKKQGRMARERMQGILSGEISV